MREEYFQIGDYIEEIIDKTTENNQFPVLTSSQKGIVSQEDYFTKQVASKDNTGYKIIREGEFTYRAMSDTGRFYINRLKNKSIGIVSPAYPVFKVNDDSPIDPDYLLLFFQSELFQSYIASKSRGSTRVSLKLKAISDLKLKKISMEEQQHIIDTIGTIDYVIDSCEALVSDYDELIRARFIDMFGPIHTNNTYSYKPVKEITKVVSGGTPDRKNNEYWEDGSIPWVKTTELQNDVLTEVEEKITPKGLDESSAKIVPKETILIAMYGQGKTRGMTAYLNLEACTNQACACLLPSENINQRYLWYYFILSYEKLRDLAKGGNQPNLNGNIIKNFNVLVPPEDMQSDYVDFADSVMRSKKEVIETLENMKLLKKTLMQESFK